MKTPVEGNEYVAVVLTSKDTEPCQIGVRTCNNTCTYAQCKVWL